MTDSISSANYLVPIQTSALAAQARRGEPVVERDRKTELPAQLVIPDAEQLRRLEEEAQSRVEVLHPIRSLDELPRRNQEALAAYRATISAATAYEGGELVGLDVYA